MMFAPTKSMGSKSVRVAIGSAGSPPSSGPGSKMASPRAAVLASASTWLFDKIRGPES